MKEIKYSVYQVSKTRWTWEVWDDNGCIKQCKGTYKSEEDAREDVREWLILKFPRAKLELGVSE